LALIVSQLLNANRTNAIIEISPTATSRSHPNETFAMAASQQA
jgi:hypothetical protein